MKSDEVRDPQIAVLDAPAGARQSRSAVGSADGVRTGDREVMGGARLLELGRRRSRHQPAGQRADDGHRHAKAQRPSECAILERLPPQGDRHGDGREVSARGWRGP